MKRSRVDLFVRAGIVDLAKKTKYFSHLARRELNLAHKDDRKDAVS